MSEHTLCNVHNIDIEDLGLMVQKIAIGFRRKILLSCEEAIVRRIMYNILFFISGLQVVGHCLCFQQTQMLVLLFWADGLSKKHLDSVLESLEEPLSAGPQQDVL